MMGNAKARTVSAFKGPPDDAFCDANLHNHMTQRKTQQEPIFVVVGLPGVSKLRETGTPKVVKLSIIRQMHRKMHKTMH